MPTESSEVISLIQARNGTLIANSTDEDLRNVLKVLFMLVGLRPQHLPCDEEKIFLLNYIWYTYPNKTDDEIILAFTLAISDKLEIDPAEVNPYDQFTPLYFTRIMNAFNKWYARVCKNKETLEGSRVHLIEDKKEMTEQDWADLLEMCKTIDFSIIPLMVYDHLTATGAIKITTDQKFEFLNQAASYHKTKLANTEEFGLYMEMFNKNEFTGDYASLVINTAKRYAIADYLNLPSAKKYAPAADSTTEKEITKQGQEPAPVNP